MVVFGASGDLTRRKLIPALFSLDCDGLLAPGFALVGYARQARHPEEFRREMMEAPAAGDGRRRDPDCAARLGTAPPTMMTWGYARLAELPSWIEQTEGNRLFYLATPPSVVPIVIARLGEAGLVSPRAAGSGWSRVVVEKPFGRDLDSAMALNRQLTQVFHEEQVYRIDHYLGKETVQNILVFRLANGIFEPLWNHHHVDHVQITVAESLGVEGRGRSFEEAGILRDMVQNHLIQLLTLVAMEPRGVRGGCGPGREGQSLKALRPVTDETRSTGRARPIRSRPRRE
jgi:glucose-6-phosphate 1-dehydrogenase